MTLITGAKHIPGTIDHEDLDLTPDTCETCTEVDLQHTYLKIDYDNLVKTMRAVAQTLRDYGINFERTPGDIGKRELQHYLAMGKTFLLKDVTLTGITRVCYDSAQRLEEAASERPGS